jgi:hypothetical protein
MTDVPEDARPVQGVAVPEQKSRRSGR